jgi:hypothetical protein
MAHLCAAPTRLVAAALIAGLVGCLYDPDDVCSRNQKLHEGVCVCVDGAILAEDRDGCTLCGADEVVSGDSCACSEGYARSDEGAPCEPLPAGLGADCTPGGVPCADDNFDYCRPLDEATGYCTSSGCETSEDCEAGHACADDGELTFCKRPPTGQGMTCDSAADCTGYEATYCESFQAHICLVSGCTVSPNSCHEGWACCDLSALGLNETLCVEQGACPTG